MVSTELGVDLEEQPESIVLKDPKGITRYFKVEQKLFHMGIRLQAEEAIEYGYQFAIHGELDCDQKQLFQELADKVKDGLARQYIEQGIFPNDQAYQTIVDDELVGRIEYNENDPDVPLIIIDGKPYTWEEVGKMMTSYEGFQFHLKIF
ncbi:DUF7713 domain-containing protein [Lentibacillus amyloliquefaciens]|nr:hypothetical protein [Lentibacillus amyloliquefaciens]